VTASAASIEEIRSQAATLEAAVTNYQATFDAFQKQLNKREETVRKGDQSVTDLENELRTKEGQIVGLIKKAEEMLGGATTAGLSSAYKTQADAFDTQLTNARRWYYGSIALLFLSVMAALDFLSVLGIQTGLPHVLVTSPNEATGTVAVQALAAIGIRALFILPALLLAGFTAHRHTGLFRLREEYKHKYTAAASVQGFKLQAPAYDESIAAAVFAELLKNPASAIEDKKPTKSRNGFLDRLILPRVDAALKKAASIPGGE